MIKRTGTTLLSIFGSALLCATLSVGSQNSQPVSSTGDKVVLKEGTDVKLKFAQELSSKTAAEGDPVNFTLDEDLVVGNVTVAKAGAKAVGTVTNAKKAGMMGKGGELNLRLDRLRLGDSESSLARHKGERRR